MLKSHILSGLSSSWRVLFRGTFVVALMSFLVACPTHIPRQLDFDETKSSPYYLSQVSSAAGSEKIVWQLLAIRALIIEDSFIRARQLLNQLPKKLNKEQQKEKNLLQGELAVKSNQYFDLTVLPILDLNDNQKFRYYKIKIVLDGQAEDINAQIRDYIELEQYGSLLQRHNTINETWLFLTGLDEFQISSILVYANEPVLQGWVDLVYTYRHNADIYQVEATDNSEMAARKEEAQFNFIKNAINEWQMQYSTHPAAQYLPRNIYGERFRLLDTTNSKKVALFLPLSGSSRVFGDTIHLGYVEAAKFYPQEAMQNIYVYDTNSNSIDNLVRQAKQQGVELIVGPLLKQDVVTIMQLSPELPVLALNKVEEKQLLDHYFDQICFFALSPEDEAKDAALHIRSQQKRRPLLILPRSDLGERIASSFAKQWYSTDLASQEGVYVQYFQSEKALSNRMNLGIGIELEGTLLLPDYAEQNDSEQGYSDQGQAEQPDQLASLLTDIISSGFDRNTIVSNLNPVEEDFDAIYVYASYEALSLIKSMLEMKSNKAQLDENGNVILDKKGNEVFITKVIPNIYASSRSNTANVTQDFRYDMDRMQFSDIPLIMSKSRIIEELPDYIKNDYSLIRLYAMGIDAWQLANSFNQLKSYQINLPDGATGKLSVANQCEITRTLTWRQYQHGKEVIVK